MPDNYPDNYPDNSKENTQRLQSQIAALEQLLEAHELSVIEQSERL